MIKKQDGGPAFPVKRIEVTERSPAGLPTKSEFIAYDGLSIRDWFAGQALAGILPERDVSPKGSAFTETEAEWIAEKAYAQADAMLKARKQ